MTIATDKPCHVKKFIHLRHFTFYHILPGVINKKPDCRFQNIFWCNRFFQPQPLYSFWFCYSHYPFDNLLLFFTTTFQIHLAGFRWKKDLDLFFNRSCRVSLLDVKPRQPPGIVFITCINVVTPVCIFIAKPGIAFYPFQDQYCQYPFLDIHFLGIHFCNHVVRNKKSRMGKAEDHRW